MGNPANLKKNEQTKRKQFSKRKEIEGVLDEAKKCYQCRKTAVLEKIGMNLGRARGQRRQQETMISNLLRKLGF